MSNEPVLVDQSDIISWYKETKQLFLSLFLKQYLPVLVIYILISFLLYRSGNAASFLLIVMPGVLMASLSLITLKHLLPEVRLSRSNTLPVAWMVLLTGVIAFIIPVLINQFIHSAGGDVYIRPSGFFSVLLPGYSVFIGYLLIMGIARLLLVMPAAWLSGKPARALPGYAWHISTHNEIIIIFALAPALLVGLLLLTHPALMLFGVLLMPVPIIVVSLAYLSIVQGRHST